MDIIILALLVAVLVLLVLNLSKINTLSKENKEVENAEKVMSEKLAIFTEGNNNFQRQIRDDLRIQISEIEKNNSQKLTDFSRSNFEQLTMLERRFQGFSNESTEKLQSIRDTLEKNLSSMQNDNNQKLDEMRKIVDEKLQETLNKRMDESFKLVSERLEQVYKGLGEMQSLAQGVGDLKKVLSNVKTRGILGEVQLDAILSQILTPEQYATNIEVVPNTKKVVEFAVKLPSDDGECVYMPMDSKFPVESYHRLQTAYENGVKEEVDAAAKELTTALKAQAKIIRDKYISPPYTTDFAIMFLPIEGLYAEAVNRGLLEVLQNEYHVNIAGPSTTAALLNSFQMGFKTLAIQKRSTEVWKVLSTVKTEFDKFEKVISATQTRLRQADTELEKLVGVRTRQIQRSLRNVTDETQKLED